MNLSFKNIYLHNFLSFKDTNINLEDKGICLVSGKNNFPIDHTQSNGSGKSSWMSAIAFALTGETIQGVKSNLKLIYTDEKDCYVKLTFTCDNVEYEITRYSEPKSALTIIKNGVDISGKTFRASEQIFAQEFPSINMNLISNTLLLGQGLPNKFSSQSPSKRKELLEELTESEYMYEEIKNKLDKREEEINSNLNDLKVETTKLISKSSVYSKSLEDLQKKKETFKIDYSSLINLSQLEQQNLREGLNTQEDKKSLLNNELEDLNKTFSTIDNLELKETQDVKDKYKDEELNLRTKLTEINSEIRHLESYIKQQASIKDVCPTCHQKLLNVKIINTDKEKEEVVSLRESYTSTNKSLSTLNENLTKEKTNIIDKYKDRKKECENKFNELNNKYQEVKSTINSLTSKYNEELRKCEHYITLASEQEKQKLSIDQDIQNVEDTLEELNTEIKKLEDDKIILDNELEVFRKISNTTKKGFRGYLLKHHIDYINELIQSYSECSKNVEFILDGNNIEIYYNSKPYDNLSGGEKQKIDIIIQLAIREMLLNQHNFSSNIICLDEIFDNLDKTGTQEVLGILNNTLKTVDSVYVISHHAEELEIDYDSELRIVKNEKGISEVR